MNIDRRRVVITGMSVVSANGCELEEFWRNLVAGRSAVRPIQRFDARPFPSRIAAWIDDRDVPEMTEGSVWAAGRGRIAQYAALAADRAITDARLPVSQVAARTGVAIAAGIGTCEHLELFKPCGAARVSDGELDWTAFAGAARREFGPFATERRSPGSIAASIAHQYAFHGPVMAVMTACAGGTQAIGDGLRWIRHGRADVVIAGGSDSELYPMGLASFCLLGALSRRNDTPAAASRPFDAGRDGFVLGEGAGMLVLEEREHALRRGARIHAEVAGFGSACDAFRVTDPNPDGIGARLAIARAINDAGITPSRIDYINAHGTSTVANDRIETLAIRQVFAERAPHIPISSTKSLMGHTTVAAGAIEAIATALTLIHQTIHPTINQDTPDPDCDLDYVPNRARAARVDAALSNSFAFGGQAASLVMRRHQS